MPKIQPKADDETTTVVVDSPSTPDPAPAPADHEVLAGQMAAEDEAVAAAAEAARQAQAEQDAGIRAGIENQIRLYEEELAKGDVQQHRAEMIGRVMPDLQARLASLTPKE